MNKAKSIAEILLILIASVFMFEGVLMVQESRADIAEFKKTVESYRARVDSTTRATEVLLRTAAKTSENIDKVSATELAYWQDAETQVNNLLSTATTTLKSVNTAVSSANAAIVNTDKSVNQTFVPAATAAVADMHAVTEATAAGITKTTDSLAPAIDEMVKVEADLDKRIADPAIDVTMNHIASATVHLDDSANNVKEATSQLAIYAKTLNAAASKLKKALEETAHLVGRFLGW